MKHLIFLLLASYSASVAHADFAVVGSKNFTEGYILSEIVSRAIENDGYTVMRQFGLGGTGIVYGAMKNGRIDAYVEYTGTLSEVILKNPKLQSIDEINKALEQDRFVISRSLGFNNTYALAVKKEFAERNHIATISDLAKLSGPIKYAFSSEFVSREDGLGGLKATYGLSIGKNLYSMEHALVYGALDSGKADVIEVYSTDAKIKKMHLQLLVDDKSYFPKYEAVVVVRRDFTKRFPKAWASIQQLEGSLTAEKMQDLNAIVEIDKKTFFEAATAFYATYKKKEVNSTEAVQKAAENSIVTRAKEHFALVLYSLIAAFVVGLPLAVVARESHILGQTILILAALIQTIPALALLCFLIPWLGIGQPIALFSLFLYGLLPITLNSYNGLMGIEQQYLEVARAMGMSYWRRLFMVDLPLASPSILAGIKTSAIISIGTATLAALVGAGGFGAPIVTGLALNDTHIILTGAVPAALFAFITFIVLSLLERLLIPKGLRL